MCIKYTHVPSRSFTSYLSSMDCDFSASFFGFFDTSFLPNSGISAAVSSGGVPETGKRGQRENAKAKNKKTKPPRTNRAPVKRTKRRCDSWRKNERKKKISERKNKINKRIRIRFSAIGIIVVQIISRGRRARRKQTDTRVVHVGAVRLTRNH